MNKIEKSFLLANALIYLLIFLFSFTQIDLNLTLTTNSTLNSIFNSFQYYGFYQRPQVTLLYLVIILLSFGFFAINLYYFYKNKLSKTYLKVTLFTNFLILVITYPFLSYDVFNYVFDAKIIVHYNLNPYTHKPLDFPEDEMLRFMRWTHRYSPYGPLWLGYTIVPYVFGFGKFILTLLSFKIFIGIFHLINAYLIYKILEKMKEPKINFYTSLYALNPALLIEGVATAHNDVIMASFLLLSIFCIQKKSTILLSTSIVSGAFIKYLTLLTLPSILLLYLRKISFNKHIQISFLCLILFTFIYSTIGNQIPFIPTSSIQAQFQPWYLFWTLPLATLLRSKSVAIVSIIVAFFAMLRYLPYLYYGVWDKPYSTQFMTLTISAAIMISLSIFLISKNHSRGSKLF